MIYSYVASELYKCNAIFDMKYNDFEMSIVISARAFCSLKNLVLKIGATVFNAKNGIANLKKISIISSKILIFSLTSIIILIAMHFRTNKQRKIIVQLRLNTLINALRCLPIVRVYYMRCLKIAHCYNPNLSRRQSTI